MLPKSQITLSGAPCDGRTEIGPIGTVSKHNRTTPSPPTNKQRKVLEFLRTYIREHGVAPSRTEIAQATGFKNRSTADYHLMVLMKKGWLELKPHQPRYIRLLHEDLPVVSAGLVASDKPLLTDTRIVDWIPLVVAEQFEPKPDFFIKIHDNTMRRAGLCTGDRVAVQATQELPQSGNIVVARTRDQVVVRRLENTHEGRITRCTETSDNTDRKDVLDFETDVVHIEGVMVGALIGRR